IGQNQPSSCVVWLIHLIGFVQPKNQIDQTNQINQTDQLTRCIQSDSNQIKSDSFLNRQSPRQSNLVTPLASTLHNKSDGLCHSNHRNWPPCHYGLSRRDLDLG